MNAATDTDRAPVRKAAATRARNGARSATGGMLDRALEGGRLARGAAGAGESDGLRGGGTLDPGSRAGRALRLAGWVVAPDHPAALTPDRVHALMVADGKVGAGAKVDDAIDEYVRLARVAQTEASATADVRAERAEAAHYREQEADDRAAERERAAVRAELLAWCDRLLYGPKRDYACDLVAAWETGGPEPIQPVGVWARKARSRYDVVVRQAARTVAA